MWGSRNINLEANIHSFRGVFMDRVIVNSKSPGRHLRRVSKLILTRFFYQIDRETDSEMTMSEVSRSLAPSHSMLHADSAGVIQPYFSQFQRTAAVAAAAAMNGFHRADLVEETGFSEVCYFLCLGLVEVR